MSQTSEHYFESAEKLIPGGVNSPARTFSQVGGTPRVINQAQGPYLYDCEGRCYIDYVGSWGPMIHGHCHPRILQAVGEAIQNSLSFGAPCQAELDLAEKVTQFIPSVEQVRFVNSGTEATMTAIRLARGYTSKDKIIKLRGCYHGHVDALLVEAGSGSLTTGQPSSAGVTQGMSQDTLIADFNDLDSVQALFETHSDDIAGIILEPIAGNVNMILPQPEFLEGLRQLCNHYHSLLIFDEVMTGFRVAKGGAQSYYQVTPDLTALGKVIGGGMPVGAVGGAKQIMQHLSPTGSVYQAGTLSGNPIAMTAGLETLRLIEQHEDFYKHLHEHSQQLTQGLMSLANQHGIALQAHSLGGMFGFIFTDEHPVQYVKQVKNAHFEHFKHFFHHMLDAGVYLAPSSFEAGFISSQHDDSVINRTLEAADSAFRQL